MNILIKKQSLFSVMIAGFIAGLLILVVALLMPESTMFAQSAGAQMQSQQENNQMTLMEQEAKYEKEKGEYLQANILDKIIGPGKAVIIVDIELGVETKVTRQAAAENKASKKKRLNDMEYLLPGVPNPKSVTNESAPGESKEESGQAAKTTVDVRTVIKSQIVTVLYDEKVSKEKLDTAKDAIVAFLKIDTKRGDRVDFKKTKFTLGFWEKMLDPFILVPSSVALLILFFLFGPLSSFFRSYVRTLREKGGTEVTVDSKFEGNPGEEGGEGGGGGGGGGGALTDIEGFEPDKRKYVPFTYIDESNFKKLTYIIRKESAQFIALVVSYLRPEFVRQILTALPPEKQAQVALEMATIRQMSHDQVVEVDNGLKEKIDYLIGGLQHLLKVLDQVDKTTAENILDYLKNEKPELYERVKKYIFTFDDIPSFPDQAMQTIIRELKVESLAKALRDAPADVLNKFLSNMSANAAAVLKEEMEYGRPLSEAEIEEERKKIIDSVKSLEREGRVFVREKMNTDILEGAQDVIPGMQVDGDSGNFSEYLSAGISMYEAGQFEDAITYFEYCTQVNASSVEAFQYLGNSYFSLGRTDQAIASFEKVLELNPENQEIREWLTQQKKAVNR